MSESAEPAEVEEQQQEVEKEQPEEEQQVAEKANESDGVQVVDDVEETVQQQKNDSEMEQELVREADQETAIEVNKEFERNENNDQKLELQQEDDEQVNEKEMEKPLVCILFEQSQNDMPLLVGNLSQGAIEDEEMPSMVTISSLSRIDESETNLRQEEEKKFVDVEGSSNKSSPKKQEDNDDSDSVCVIDDDTNDEDEGEDNRGSSYDDEDGSSSYPDDDSEEDERMHHAGNYYRRGSRGGKRMEDDENEEDEEDEDDEDEEDDPESPRMIAMNDYSDPDGFECGSDDLVHRHSNGFTRHQQERSNSLQDLSLINCERPQRRSMNPFSQKAIFQRNQERRPSTQGKFAHVESKVKQYIQNMSEQRRISGEIRKKSKEEARHKQQEMAEIQICRNEDVVLTCRTMKDYTEKTLKEAVECYEKNSEYFVPNSMGNGDTMVQDQMDVDQVDVETHKSEEKLDKMNGAAFTENQNNFIPERKGIHRREEYTQKSISNGEDAGNIVCDLRTLSYEEYMKGSDKEINEEVIHEESVSQEIQEISENCNNKTETGCGFQIESVVSNYRSTEAEDDEMYNRKTPVMMVDKSTATVYQEDPVINQLRSELHQRNMQFDNLRDAYQKTMSENLGMKMELENLRKMVAQYQQRKSPLETKVIAIQTEAPTEAPSMPMIDDDNTEPQVNPRLTTTSLISAVSSQWSDSTGSAAISMEPPPNVTTALNSDESANQQPKTPKMRNPLSRAFMTSQRILQTLSSITHGKSKSDKVSRKRSRTSAHETPNEAGTSAQNVNAESVDAGPPNSKKRKAEDSEEHSSTAQPLKIPHTDKTRKTSEASEAPVIDLEDSNVNADDEDINGDEDVYVKNFDDDVKVFVYPESEAGKEHSFLIQAKEVTSNPKPGVRECGPYLLGNVEVYMTEMNGTINIWGKELSQASTSQNNEELNASIRSKDPRPGFRWQSTPRIFNNQSLSTSKKSKVLPRFTHHHQQHSCDVNNTVADCDSCNGHNHRLTWPSCNHSAHENQHTCCPPTVRVEETPCGCVHKEERRSNCCGVPTFDDGRRFSMPNVYHQSKSPCCYNSHHSHCRNFPQAETHRHQPFVRRHSFNPTDEDEEESAEEENPHLSPNFGHSANENSPHSCSNKLVPPGSCTKKGNGDDFSEPPSCQNDNDPLISQKQTSETLEGRKRKLSGRKVRGLLLDLLKGCGDCRTSNPVNKSALHHNASVYQPSTSTQQRACSPHQQSCSPRANEKCSSCRQRNDKTSEIEAQLEFFREEMDKLRSRSDALRDMLDTLRNEEIIN
ncbi:hypothetical protein TSAR_006366 [Trichomalopsis sarcophagae]|uniref:Uncharacterized protein n=1 Tax=Trichomalopsis sarcophagae TaxID=543379 RepID=A0A232EY00_9HYME|nr:hypothetical protein TSAR_006366 [Trichomalopsis sarcophagae]